MSRTPDQRDDGLIILEFGTIQFIDKGVINNGTRLVVWTRKEDYHVTASLWASSAAPEPYLLAPSSTVYRSGSSGQRQ
jgi:hypothetical protein